MLRTVSQWLGKGLENTYWVMQEMDVTQWGIVSVLFVVTGFMCLRSNL